MIRHIRRISRRALLTTVGFSIALPLSAQDLVLEEIVVTAQKREETLQDISATVNVVSGHAIDQFSVQNFGDLEQMTSGLSLTTQNARTTKVSLRGVSNDPEGGNEAGVDIYFNGVLVRNDTAFSQLFDIERIEILRGPQGALQGRTSPAGAIIMNTRMPSLDETEASIQATFSDNGGFNTQVAVGTPIIDGVLGVRIAGVYDENNANDVTNITTGLESTDLGKAARFSVAFQPNDVFSANLVHQYYERFTDDPKVLSGTDALGVRPTLRADDRIALANENDFAELRYDLTTLEMSLQKWGQDFTLLTGYETSDKGSKQDNDIADYITNRNLTNVQGVETRVEKKSVEFRISSIDNDNWDYMFGLYYLDQDTDTLASVNGQDSRIPFPFGFLTLASVPVNSENLAAFTFNTFRFNDSWSLDVGARVQKRNRFNRTEVNIGGVTYIDPAFAALAGVIVDGLFAAFPIEGVDRDNLYDSSTNVTGTVALRYDYSDDLSLYGSVARANRAGGISIIIGNALPLVSGAGLLNYDEEDSTAFELGFKGRFLDGRATLNGALFYQEFDGYQSRVTKLQAQPPGGAPLEQISGGIFFNGDATVTGLELEGEILFSENWSGGGSMSYAIAEFDDSAIAPCNEREPGDIIGFCGLGGTAISPEPEFSLSVNSEYTVPFGGSEWYLRGLLKHTGERDNQTASAGIGNVLDEFPDYTILNLFTGVRSQDGQWDVSLWAKNLTDEDGIILQEGSDAPDLRASGDPGSYNRELRTKERIIGLTARYNFAM